MKSQKTNRAKINHMIALAQSCRIVAHHHPRLHTIAINGFPPVPETEGIMQLRYLLAKRGIIA
ncbi:MAG: hypothetical protein C4534_02055 [Gaiellales bacterium]|nr:MAG: hypothetical protein C4534_02055 [Gaiellales bacterium]